MLLKEAKKKIMITGFCVKSKDDRVFDYCGCLYPEGVISSEKNLMFNHDKIDKIFYMGYKDDEAIEFNAKLKLLINKIEKGEIDF